MWSWNIAKVLCLRLKMFGSDPRPDWPAALSRADFPETEPRWRKRSFDSQCRLLMNRFSRAKPNPMGTNSKETDPPFCKMYISQQKLQNLWIQKCILQCQNSDHISLQRKRSSKGHEVGLQKAVLGELFTLCYGCVCFNDVQFSSIFENVWENIFVSDT